MPHLGAWTPPLLVALAVILFAALLLRGRLGESFDPLLVCLLLVVFPAPSASAIASALAFWVHLADHWSGRSEEARSAESRTLTAPPEERRRPGLEPLSLALCVAGTLFLAHWQGAPALAQYHSFGRTLTIDPASLVLGLGVAAAGLFALRPVQGRPDDLERILGHRWMAALLGGISGCPDAWLAGERSRARSLELASWHAARVAILTPALLAAPLYEPSAASWILYLRIFTGLWLLDLLFRRHGQSAPLPSWRWIPAGVGLSVALGWI